MPDTNTPTPAPAPSGDNKSKRAHGLLDKKQLIEISKTGTIFALVSADTTLFDRIKDDQIITPDFMLGLKNDLHFVGQYTGDASEATIDIKLKTKAEKTARQSLLAVIRYIQSKAKQKYSDTNPGMLAEYSVGVDIDISRVALETAATNILNKVQKDTLPKVDAAKMKELTDAASAYKQTEVDQTNEQGDATTLRAKLAALVNTLATRRRQIQHAAASEFPHTDKANSGIRRKFGLPANKPFNP